MLFRPGDAILLNRPLYHFTGGTIRDGFVSIPFCDFGEIMEIIITPWQLAGALLGIMLGIATAVGLLLNAGIKIGNFATRNDLSMVSASLDKKIGDEVGALDWKVGDKITALDKKIGDEVAALDKKIEDEVAALDKKIEDETGRLEKKIEDETGRLEKKIEDETGRLERKIEDETGRLERKIEDETGRLERKIDDNNAQVLLAIQNLGSRLENAILDHTHDEDGVAVFRRHPQMVDADD